MDRKEHMAENQTKYLNLCKRGLTRSEIANELGVTTRTVLCYQTNTGISPKPEYDFEYNLRRYIELCKEGYTRKEISEELHVTIKTVGNYIRRTGVLPKANKRKPKLNEHFFDVIDTEEKAYILGFLSADGYVDGNGRSLCLNLNSKDIDILYKIKNAMNCENPITKSTTKNCCRLNMSSKYLVETISRYGIVQNKSRTLPFPKLEKEMYRHYFRGYCDGDGCVHKRQVTIIIGSEFFYNGFVKYLQDSFNMKISASPVKGYFRVLLSRKDLDIVMWMYDGAKIYLDRKYKSYIENWKSYAEKRRSSG